MEIYVLVIIIRVHDVDPTLRHSFAFTRSVIYVSEMKVTLMKWIGAISHVLSGLGTCTQSIIIYEWTLELLRVSQGFRM
jgi:hypothetical protein